MKITFLGIYSNVPEYPRVSNLIKAIRRDDFTVFECHFPMVLRFQERIKSVNSVGGSITFLAKLVYSYANLIIKFYKLPSADVFFVLYPGLFHIHFAKLLSLLTRKKPIVVYDFFFSMHDTLVNDRRLFQPGSLRSRLLFMMERSSLRTADIILTDTATHAGHFSREFGIPSHKFHSIPVGSTLNIEEAIPGETSTESRLKLLFVGTYIPLHGIETILRAAYLVKHDNEISFTLVGKGQLKDNMHKLAEQLDLVNVHFLDWVRYDKLLETIRQHDVCLGIFGTTIKAQNVIPIKVYDICASGLPLITADTPAIREVFTHGENAYLVPAGDPNELAQAIMRLKEDHDLRTLLAAGAARTYNREMSTQAIGTRIADALEDENR